MRLAYGDEPVAAAVPGKIGEAGIRDICNPSYRRLAPAGQIGGINVLISVVHEIKHAAGDEEFPAAILMHPRPGRVGRGQEFGHAILRCPAHDRCAPLLRWAALAPIDSAVHTLNPAEAKRISGYQSRGNG